MSKNKLKSVFAFALAPFFCVSIFAEASSSTQSHFSDVTNIAYLESGGESSALSAGKDGFLIKWRNDGTGEHYQVSDLPIKMISRSPNGYEIAVYESDGASLNRVSVWNWRTFTRKFAYRFTDTITSLSYSAKGTYLMVGTASVNGLSMINSSTGNIVNGKIPSGAGVVNFICTSDTEKTAIAYSSKGVLSYYNLLNGKQKAKYLTEDSLSQVGLFNNNVFLAGVRGNNIYIVQAVTGKTVGKYSAQRPVLIASNKSQDLYYIVSENHDFKVYKIQNDRNKAVIAPELMRTFSGLKDGEAIVCAAFAGEEIYAGTNRGNIYKFDYVQAERVDVVQPISDTLYDKIFDVASDGSDFYFLSENSLFKSSYDNNSVARKGLNSGHTNVIANGGNVVLWSKDTRRPVELLDVSTGVSRTVFTPKSAVQVLRIFGNSLIDVEASSFVNIIDLETGNKKQVYSGTGIQDALATSEKDLYIAKSSASNPEVPLLYVNIETQETVPLSNVRGNIAYSLNFDRNRPNEFYGVLIYTDARSKKLTTSVFAFDISRKSIRNLLTISDEDNEAFTYLRNSVLYTNIGKSQIRSYNLQTRKSFLYKRSASMPLKVAGNGNKIAVLNRNGSVSWYNPDTSNVLSDWNMTADGQWSEF
ncbi:MAG: WD40 repeat domain-containing protein [Treponema sp.]|nr:WD40 repeat domain-containing protein [Treponema sp.]